MSRRRAALAAACVLTALATGCGGKDDEATPSGGTPEADQVYLPSESAGPEVSMIEPPADYVTIEGTGFSISAPSEFQQQRFTSSNGEPGLLLETPSRVAAVPQRVAVIRDVAPKSSAAQQSFALETAKAAGGAEAEVTRAELPAREGQAAFLVTWREERPSQGAANVGVTYWQLMYQTGDDLIFNIVAFAPTDEFETSEVSKILRTFTVDEG